MTQRPTPGNGYLERISDDKCDVTFSRIKEITENGLVTEDGTEHKLDVLICANELCVAILAEAACKVRSPARNA